MCSKRKARRLSDSSFESSLIRVVKNLSVAEREVSIDTSSGRRKGQEIDSLVDVESLPTSHRVRSNNRMDGSQVLAFVLRMSSVLSEGEVRIGRGVLGLEEGCSGMSGGQG